MTDDYSRQQSRRSVHCRVEGRVQGVFFRASTRTQATQLGLVGRVRNLGDGAVEVIAQGEPDAVAALVGWLWQGSPLSLVTGVTVTDTGSVALDSFVSE